MRRQSGSTLMAIIVFFPVAGLIPSGSALAATYYIDYATGSDSNDGKSKSTPWKHHPYMAGRTGSYSHSAGDRFIFKGGVTWDHTSLSLNIKTGGSSTSPDYYGVDLTWYTGTSFTRPIFNGGHTKLASGSNIITIAAPYVIIDNIEVTGLLISSNNWLQASIQIAAVNNITIRNCYVHDWKAGAGVTYDDARGGILANFYAGSPATNTIVENCVISNAEQTAKMNGVAIRMIETVRNTVIHDVPTAVLFARNVYGNTFYNINHPTRDFDSNYHTNLLYLSLPDGHTGPLTYYVYNNWFYSVRAGTNIYAEACYASDDTQYIYNNVIYDLGAPIPTFTVDPEGGRGPCGTVYIWNNTAVRAAGDPTSTVLSYQNHIGTNNIKALTVRNNYLITDVKSPIVSTGVGTFLSDHNIIETVTKATSGGYMLSNRYAPSGVSGVTVGAGADLTSSCIGSLVALCSDTSLGGSRTPLARPKGSAWDAGAYQYAGTAGPAPPTGLKAVTK